MTPNTFDTLKRILRDAMEPPMVGGKAGGSTHPPKHTLSPASGSTAIALWALGKAE